MQAQKFRGRSRYRLATLKQTIEKLEMHLPFSGEASNSTNNPLSYINGFMLLTIYLSCLTNIVLMSATGYLERNMRPTRDINYMIDNIKRLTISHHLHSAP